MPVGRQDDKSNYDNTLEGITRQISSINNRMSAMQTSMNRKLDPASITQVNPSVPFKIDETSDESGEIYCTVTGTCPISSENIKITCLRVSDNQVQKKKDGTPKETVEQAKVRAIAKAANLTFEVPIPENQSAVGIFTVQIGPFKPKKKDGDDQIQVMRMIVDDGKSAIAKTPTLNPFKAPTMVADPTTTATAALHASAGMLTAGAYKYKFSFLIAGGESLCGPASNTVTVVTPGTAGQIDLTAIPVSAASNVIGRKVYRTPVNGTNFQLVDTILNNTATTFLDNLPDALLGLPEPTDNSTAGFPFTALIVSTDDGGTLIDESRYFTIGNSIQDSPSDPATNKILCNQVKKQAHASHAKLSFQIDADKLDPEKTFADKNITEVIIVLKKKTDNALGGANADSAGPIHFKYTIIDASKTSAIVDGILDFGDVYTWVKNVLKNATVHLESTGAAVDFVAGGDIDLTHLIANFIGQPGASTNGKFKLSIGENAGGHKEFIAEFLQPGVFGSDPTPCSLGAVIAKRIIFRERKPNSSTFDEVAHHKLLEHADFFVPGKPVLVRKKVPHRPNHTDYQYDAILIGIADPETTLASGVIGSDTSLGVIPVTPTLAMIVENRPDDETADADALTTFRVELPDQATTWRSLDITEAYVKIRRKKLASTGSADDQETTLANGQVTKLKSKLPSHGGPIPVEFLDQYYTFITVRREKLGRQYYYYQAIIGRTGIYAFSAIPAPDPPGGVPYLAGFGTTGDALDPTRITNLTITFRKLHKNTTRVLCAYDQPSSPGSGAPASGAQPTPVLIKEGVLLEQLADDTTFAPMHTKNLRHIPEYSDNTTGSLPHTDATLKYRKYFHFKIHHKEATAGMKFKFRLQVVGGGVIESAEFTFTSDADAPSYSGIAVPSDPRLSDITTALNGHMAARSTRTVFRVYASAWRDSGVPLGFVATGPNSTLIGDPNFNRPTVCWLDIGADSVHIILLKVSEMMSATGNAKFRKTEGGPIVDPTQNYYDVEVGHLTIGEQYIWRLSLCAKSGAKSMSATVDILFTAGGRVGSANLKELLGPTGTGAPTLTYNPIDAHVSELIFDYFQPDGSIIPAAPSVTVIAGAGALTAGPYRYKVANVDSVGNESNPSLPSNQVTIVTPGVNGTVRVVIAVGGATIAKRKIYRTPVNNSTDYKLLVTINDNTTTIYNDIIADINLGILTFDNTPALLFKSVLRRQRFTTAGVAIDSSFKRIDHENLLDDPQYNIVSAQYPNPKRVVLIAKHKKDEQAKYRVDILGVGNTAIPAPTLMLFFPSSGNQTIPNEQLFEDTAVPGAVGTPILTFSGKGMMVQFTLPTTNMITHIKNTLVFKNDSFIPVYWNPLTGATSAIEIEIDIAKGHFTFPVRKRSVPSAFKTGFTSFTVEARVYNSQGVSSAFSNAITFSSLTDVIDVANSLASYTQMIHNGDFLYKRETDPVTGDQPTALKKWFTSVGGSVIFDNSDMTKQISWSQANHSLLLRGNSGSGGLLATPANKLGKRLVSGDFFSVSFLARSNTTVTVNMTVKITDNAGVNVGSFTFSFTATTQYQLIGGTMQLSAIADRTAPKWLQITLDTSILWTQNIEIDRVMMVRGKQPVAYTPRPLYEQGSTVTGDNGLGGENFDIDPSPQNGTLDMAQPSGLEGGFFNTGTGGTFTS